MDMSIQTISLVAACNSNGELLLLKRPDDVHCGSLWSFPGGKVEAGETPLDAAKRELAEETALTGKNWRLLGEYQYTYPDRTLHFHLFGCDGLDSDTLNSTEAHAWVPVDKLGGYPMPEANQASLACMVHKSHDGPLHNTEQN
ncbi:MAG: (deoxy)nucleoside triphosphate pyrophosphohydrolase [Mariprofundaceae bacterium]|nr:(deoxy)nucleoside triphosphate pyrophosphohydrolase [Mariprofundaceae bacterium]